MAQTFMAQNTFTVRRTRTNENLSLTFENNGKPLYQCVTNADTSTPTVSPDWTVTANQPVVTPKLTSLSGGTVTLSDPVWQYNGTTLVFTGSADTDGYLTDTTSRFKMHPTTGALRIIANLASATNVASDSLSFSCNAVTSGVEYQMNGTLTINIQNSGSNAYYAYITATTAIIDKTTTTTELTAGLMLGGTDLTLPGIYTLKWYKNDTEWTAAGNSEKVTVTREDVNAVQLFILKVYQGSELIASAGIYITDAADDYTVIFANVANANGEVNDRVSIGNPVRVQCTMAKVANGSTPVTSGTFAWVLYLYAYRNSTWTQLSKTTSTLAQPTIDITTDHTDNGSEISDVDIVAEVSLTA